MKYFEQSDNSLVFRQDGETVMVTPWGKNSFRVRACILGEISEDPEALLDPAPSEAKIDLGEDQASIENGNIRAELTVNPWGQALQITFKNQKGEVILQEIPNGGALQKKARHFKPLSGGSFS